jgi:hypothetical protein
MRFAYIYNPNNNGLTILKTVTGTSAVRIHKGYDHPSCFKLDIEAIP